MHQVMHRISYLILMALTVLVAPLVGAVLALHAFYNCTKAVIVGVHNGFSRGSNPKKPQTMWEKHIDRIETKKK